jgi:hypothetical protein
MLPCGWPHTCRARRSETVSSPNATGGQGGRTTRVGDHAAITGLGYGGGLPLQPVARPPPGSAGGGPTGATWATAQ